jgi:hypothetical protein
MKSHKIHSSFRKFDVEKPHDQVGNQNQVQHMRVEKVENGKEIVDMFKRTPVLFSLYKQYVSCTSCNTKITQSGLCNICQVKRLSKQNYFELLEQPLQFRIDARELRKKFLVEQAKWHPDLFTNKSPSEREESDLKSAKLNKAYEVIKDPLSRAHYLVKCTHIAQIAREGDNRTNTTE